MDEQLPTPQATLQSPAPAPRWADFVQAGNWQQLGIVDPERASKVTEQDIIDMVRSARDESSAARQPLEDSWYSYEELFRLPSIPPGTGWDPKKQAWQSQVPIPEIRDKVRVAVSLIQSGLFDAPQWFSLMDERKNYDDHLVRFSNDWLGIVADQSQLIDSYLRTLEEGFLFGSGCMSLSIEDYVEYRPHVQPPSPEEIGQWQMATWQAQVQGLPPPPQPQPTVTVQPQFKKKFIWRHRSIWDVYPDPYADDFYAAKYVVEESAADESDVEDRWRSGVYDSIDDIGEPVRFEGDRRPQWRRRELHDAKHTARPQHLVQEYTGNIYDRDGKIVARNWIVTVINERTIVRIGPNPLWRGNSRYVWCTPLPYRNRVWGQSLIDADSHVQLALTDFINLMLDDMRYAVLGAFQLDTSLSQEPLDPTTIEPGRVYHGRGQFLQKLAFQTNANTAWPLLNKLEQIGQKSAQISEFVDGSPSSRGRPTAAEVTTKTTAGQAYIHNVMRNLERNDLERALNLTWQHILQFGGDRSDPVLQDLLQDFGGPQLLTDDLARYQLLDKPWKYQVRAISKMLDRESVLPRLMQLLQLTMQVGAPPPQQAQILYTIITALGFDPVQFGWPTSPEEYQMMLQQMAMAQAGAGGPGAGNAPGGAPEPVSPAPGAQGVMLQAQGQGPPMPG